ncbi:translation initiation factor eIF-2B subunit gamma [Amborella trichopoda]|uniref:Translation initiation factor eIF2B subunit gamma n=1 Tax=Amborella trichopoda TaxID=13333 RepID=W1NWM5_AMBTC|nr:translation initiation factor eIF-2B subunit gamma [Amborella trichopoda]ERM99089.1 hypothetical protein AMTR_s00101p00117720 [Amborella trichopoda]|eukprot:XP_006836236.1 translation initiation factor eIF-2B subunit gamma [Amborella trichopoda]
MDFQVVVLAGGTSKNLIPLVSKDVPKALLPVANRPVLSYVLELLEASNLKDLILVVEGQDAALQIGSWVSGAYADRLHVEVATVSDDAGTAGGLRAVAHHLTASDILVVSGDLLCDVPPGAIAAAHRRQDATMTALLCVPPVSGPSESGSAGGKDKAKKPGPQNIIGLDSSKQFLLFVASGAEVEKDVRIQRSILRAAGQMEIRADLMDAHLYAFNRTVLLEVLNEKPTFQSIKLDVVPYLVRSQLKSEALSSGEPLKEEGWNENGTTQNNQSYISEQHVISTHGFLQQRLFGSNGLIGAPKMRKCCAYIAPKHKYCARLNSIQAFSDINRDVIGEAIHLTGYSLSSHNNIIHPTAELGTKTTVGPHCMLGEGSQLGDKCSVKRSAIGRHCRIGSSVKIINSVVMNHVTIEDGCLIQSSVVCSNVHLQERVILKDCQVGAGYVVSAGSQHKADSLARKEKA